jgi:hypothetical protein
LTLRPYPRMEPKATPELPLWRTGPSHRVRRTLTTKPRLWRGANAYRHCYTIAVPRRRSQRGRRRRGATARSPLLPCRRDVRRRRAADKGGRLLDAECEAPCIRTRCMRRAEFHTCPTARWGKELGDEPLQALLPRYAVCHVDQVRRSSVGAIGAADVCHL